MNDIEWHLLEVEHSLQKDGTNCGVFMCIFFERLVNSNFDLNFLLRFSKMLMKLIAQFAESISTMSWIRLIAKNAKNGFIWLVYPI